jgi:hypothetical protein
MPGSASEANASALRDSKGSHRVAPRPGGRIARPGRVRRGIPAAIDSVTCRALSGQAREGGPPILGPAQLAMELAAVTRPGPSSESSPGAAPAPTLPARAAWLPPPRSRPVRRLTGLTAVIILAVLAGGGWLAVREMTAPHRPSGARPAVAAQALTPVSATAFGPLGESDGDNPEHARLAIDGSPATAWHTHWYATAAFGNLKPGTGLLLDMGRPVTITSAQITLGAITGAEFQLRAGGEPVLADLRPVARAADAGGAVTMRPARPTKARYLLLWFTRLPPDSSGMFEAIVYDVRLQALRKGRQRCYLLEDLGHEPAKPSATAMRSRPMASCRSAKPTQPSQAATSQNRSPQCLSSGTLIMTGQRLRCTHVARTGPGWRQQVEWNSSAPISDLTGDQSPLCSQLPAGHHGGLTGNWWRYADEHRAPDRRTV